MINRKTFFDGYRQYIDHDKKLTQQEVDALDQFLTMVDANEKLLSKSQWAYVLATVFHETNGTFLPVKEAYWLSETWRKNNLRYYPYYGRGYVQITWKDNYAKFSKQLGEDFVKNPDLVMIPKYSFRILVDGFINGSFTDKKISDYINSNKVDFINARRCINGTDKAELISKYARNFENIIIGNNAI